MMNDASPHPDKDPIEPNPKEDEASKIDRPESPNDDGTIPLVHPEPDAATFPTQHPATPSPIHPSQPSTTRPVDLSTPPRRRSKLTIWLLLIFSLCVVAAPIYLDLNRGDVIFAEEARAISTSSETLRRLYLVPPEGFTLEPFVPVYNGEQLLHAPPAGTWLQMIGYWLSDLWGQVEYPQQYITSARLTSAGFALLALAAVYWAGFSIGGNVLTALFATGILASNPIFLHYARLGTSDMPTLAFMMLSIAGALWSVRPLRPTAVLERQAIGWSLCGLSLGMAILTGGPALAAQILFPLLIIMILCPHRASHLLGLLASILIAALLITPWVLYVHEQAPEGWMLWLQDVAPTDLHTLQHIGALLGIRLLTLLLITLPWMFWLIGGIVQPFSTSSSGARLRMFLGWTWYLTMIVLVLMQPNEQILSTALLTLPVFAILVGQMFRQYTELAAEGRFARFWRILRWPHIGLLLIISIMAPLALYLEPILIRYGYTTTIFSQDMHWTYWAGVGTALIGLLFVGSRSAIKNYPVGAVIFWAVWGISAYTTIMIPFVRGPIFVSGIKHGAHSLGLITGPAPVYFLDEQPNPILLLYANKSIPEIPRDQAESLALQGTALFLVTPYQTPGTPPIEPPAGYTLVGNYMGAKVSLWASRTEARKVGTIPDVTQQQAVPSPSDSSATRANEANQSTPTPAADQP
ncbi:ArnT family glycosyltransferase [Poriferisphaera sp. WC338]|uniref:ArnT family glycosyltransferase n=1 Tax=Poriferisphaera sp. WC338 TaxID=3425129 RepID=UPI003D814FD5